MQRRWIFPSAEDDKLVRRLGAELGAPEFVARLVRRGEFETAEGGRRISCNRS